MSRIFATETAYALIDNDLIPIPHSGILCMQDELEWEYRWSLGWIYGWDNENSLWQSIFYSKAYSLYLIPLSGTFALKTTIFPCELVNSFQHEDSYMIYSVMEDRMVADSVKDPERWIQYLKENNELSAHEDRFDIIPVKTVRTVKLETELKTTVNEVK